MRMLAELLAAITGKPRRRQEIWWRSDSLVHNAFMAWKAIFWARDGIRFENSVFFDPTTGRSTYKYGTWEALLFDVEECVKNLFKKGIRIPVKIYVPVFQEPITGFRLPASPYLFAIAFDTEVHVANATSPSTTISRGTGASNYAAFLQELPAGGSRTSSGATYGGAAMTQFFDENGTANVNGTNGHFYGFYIVNPASGSQTVTSTTTASYYMETDVFSGVDQTNPLDPDFGGAGVKSVRTNFGSVTNGSRTVSGTSHVDNSVGIGMPNSEGINPTSMGANTSWTVAAQVSFWNTAPITPAGTVSLIANYVGTSPSGFFTASGIQPAVAAGPTGVKTWDGVTQSTGIKTYMGLALASVKSVLGVS